MPPKDYIPICGEVEDNKFVTFFSPCHLGCHIEIKEQNTTSKSGVELDKYTLTTCGCIG